MTFFRDNKQNNNTSVCKVFKQMTQAEGMALLKKSRSQWLMRESMQKGMLTVDTVKGSMRFGLTNKGWEMIDNTKLTLVQLGIIIIDPVSADKAAVYAQQLFKALEKKGYTSANQLAPISQAMASQSNYYQSFRDEPPQQPQFAKPNEPEKPQKKPDSKPPGGPSFGPTTLS